RQFWRHGEIDAMCVEPSGDSLLKVAQHRPEVVVAYGRLGLEHHPSVPSRSTTTSGGGVSSTRPSAATSVRIRSRTRAKSSPYETVMSIGAQWIPVRE